MIWATSTTYFDSAASTNSGFDARNWFSGMESMEWRLPLTIFLLAVGVFVVLYLIIMLSRLYVRRHRLTPAQSRKVLLRVQVPKFLGKNTDSSQAPSAQQIQEAISVTENIFNAIGSLPAKKGLKTWWLGHDDEVGFEVVVKNSIIYFYVSVPQYLQNYLEEQIHAQHPYAVIEEIDDYNIFQPTGVALGSYLKYVKDSIYPIRSYKKMEGDPMNALLNALSKFDNESGGAIQMIFRSADGAWHKRSTKVASLAHQGKKLEDAFAEANKGPIASFFDWFKKEKKDGEKDTYRLTSKEDEAVKGIEEKTSKAGLDVNIRLVVSAQNKNLAEQRLNDLLNAFNLFNIYEYGNGFKPEKPSRLDSLMDKFIFREFDEGYKMLMNVEEMASIFHFPLPFTDAPNIDWLLSKKAPAPLNTPTEGLLLGENEYRGKLTPIHIKPADRRRHMYVIGMTGTGKSVFLEGLAIQDILAGRGVCFIDPHGDAIDTILARTPKERADDVILFDPSDLDRPMSLNLFEFDSPAQRTMAVNELLAIFDKLYDLKSTGGPMFEQYFRNAALLMMEDPESGNTILDLPRILADDDYRQMKLSKAKDEEIKNFWIKQAQKAGGEASLQNIVPYITSKLTTFISNDYMRPIIAQQKSSFNFGEAVNSNKIILVKLSKGLIGSMNADLLGMIVIGKILMAVLGRASIPEDQRTDYYLYIDEFQNFLTDSIEVILSEARKYKLNLTVAHQYIGQLINKGDTRFKDAIFGNVGTKVAFRIGVEDSEFLAKEFAPVFNESDFLNCPKATCYTKLLIDNANPPAFNMKVPYYDKYATANPKVAMAIRELSRLKYGRDRAIIEEEIRQKQLNLDL
jgi:hypothetical protein